VTGLTRPAEGAMTIAGTFEGADEVVLTSSIRRNVVKA